MTKEQRVLKAQTLLLTAGAGSRKLEHADKTDAFIMLMLSYTATLGATPIMAQSYRNACDEAGGDILTLEEREL